jgi:hypothetical protein
MPTLDQIHEFLKPFYSYIALAVTWAGLGWAWWRRKRAWRNKEFLGQVNFTLNLFADTLQMRTLLELDTDKVWPNTYGVGLLRRAAQRTTLADPFIRLADPADRDYLHRAVKNALSALCAEAFISAAAGGQSKRATFLFAITCERYPEMRTIKLRVLLIEQHALREWCAPGGKAEGLPITPYYRTRLLTLQAMHKMDAAAQAGGPTELGRVELGVPA